MTLCIRTMWVGALCLGLAPGLPGSELWAGSLVKGTLIRPASNNCTCGGSYQSFVVPTTGVLIVIKNATNEQLVVDNLFFVRDTDFAAKAVLFPRSENDDPLFEGCGGEGMAMTDIDDPSVYPLAEFFDTTPPTWQYGGGTQYSAGLSALSPLRGGWQRRYCGGSLILPPLSSQPDAEIRLPVKNLQPNQTYVLNALVRMLGCVGAEARLSFDLYALGD